jgi:hypothetical protein
MMPQERLSVEMESRCSFCAIGGGPPLGSLHSESDGNRLITEKKNP